MNNSQKQNKTNLKKYLPAASAVLYWLVLILFPLRNPSLAASIGGLVLLGFLFIVPFILYISRRLIRENIYNIFLVISLWFLFIIVNYVFWNSIVNLFDNVLFIYIYILLAPIVLTKAIYKLAKIENHKDKKFIAIFGVFAPLFIYYTCVGLFMYFVIQAFKNAHFSF